MNSFRGIRPDRAGGKRSRARWAVAGLLVVVAVLLLLDLRPGDPALYPGRPGDEVEIFVVSNGFHSGLILPREALAKAAGDAAEGTLLAVATRFRTFGWIEAGWGESRFYQAVPNRGAFDWGLALRALFAPGNASVMHVVGIARDPAVAFVGAQFVRLSLSRAGFARLTRALNASFARDTSGLPREIGPGLYGPSLFYEGVGTFSIFNVCNHWTARLLAAAGVPTAPLLSTLPAGLMWDLRLRAGAATPPATPASNGFQIGRLAAKGSA